MAQQQGAESGFVVEAARNKIGLIRYCRKNELLDPALADQAVAAVETGLRDLPPGDISVIEQGDRAQQAGEEGFWEIGRRRDIASVATLFRTTPADLCREWADETLRAQGPKPTRDVVTIIDAAPIEAPNTEPVFVATPPASTTEAKRAARAVLPPPLPKKAPLPPREAELASLPRTLPTSGDLDSDRKAAAGQKAAIKTPRRPGQAASLSARPAADTAGALPRERTATAVGPSRRLDERAYPLWEAPPLNRPVKSERCWMPGCKWPTPQDRRFW
jgi:hypothetical protein